jgi:hypothetical protein
VSCARYGDETAAEALLQSSEPARTCARRRTERAAALVKAGGPWRGRDRGLGREARPASLASGLWGSGYDEAALGELLSRAPSGPIRRSSLRASASARARRRRPIEFGSSPSVLGISDTREVSRGLARRKIGADTRNDAVTRAVRRGCARSRSGCISSRWLCKYFPMQRT